ncbi:VQ motif [Musa troglodytarum]|uniref:VQ motif n=1 Tax=Musa troglodytarum TaxID=320322 RepID=A0A9E7EDN5_9LILI|nr:VQ motif [Musa troglodytarum]
MQILLQLAGLHGNNNKSTDKFDADGLSCSSAAVTGSAGDSTTYVHADPANFRALVQRLTGPAGNYSVHKLPVASAAAAAAARKVGSKRQKLQERRRASTKLEIDIGHSLYRASTTTRRYRPHHHHRSNTTVSWRHGDEVRLLLSPISTVDSCFFASSASPTTATKDEEEERAIAEKRFYLHPSPGSNNGDPPKLLSLFPLHSPKNSFVSSSE